VNDEDFRLLAGSHNSTMFRSRKSVTFTEIPFIMGYAGSMKIILIHPIMTTLVIRGRSQRLKKASKILVE